MKKTWMFLVLFTFLMVLLHNTNAFASGAVTGPSGAIVQVLPQAPAVDPSKIGESIKVFLDKVAAFPVVGVYVAKALEILSVIAGVMSAVYAALWSIVQALIRLLTFVKAARALAWVNRAWAVVGPWLKVLSVFNVQKGEITHSLAGAPPEKKEVA